MAAIARCQLGDKGRFPLGHKTPIAFNGGKAVKHGVDDPELVATKGQIVHHQRASQMTGTRQKGNIMLSFRLNFGRNISAGRKAPDRLPTAHC
jgi:hypothetical protein